MAVNKNNVVVSGSSGKLGNTMVFRQRGRLTVLAQMPYRSKRYVPTENQKAHQLKFTAASFYAQGVLQNPVLKAAYTAKAKGNQSAYNMAIKDYLTPPLLASANCSSYTGKIGSTITLAISDVLAVVTVKIVLYTNDGTLVEEGMAVQDAENAMFWVYTATAVNTPVSGMVLMAYLTSTPGNVYKHELVIS
ncbi:hypothetical protein ACG2LH_11635 [Zhouia sp. PK063]|uniref:hypothetical protein n=1 Tax=Zhouia sp. PK063 TaxID=3373602 RepID=UPI00378BA3CF